MGHRFKISLKILFNSVSLEISIMKHAVVPIILVILVAVKSSLAIHCYSCNSIYEPACADILNGTLHQVNCGVDETLALEATICRKLTQTSLCQKTRRVLTENLMFPKLCSLSHNSDHSILWIHRTERRKQEEPLLQAKCHWCDRNNLLRVWYRLLQQFWQIESSRWVIGSTRVDCGETNCKNELKTKLFCHW